MDLAANFKNEAKIEYEGTLVRSTAILDFHCLFCRINIYVRFTLQSRLALDSDRACLLVNISHTACPKGKCCNIWKSMSFITQKVITQQMSHSDLKLKTTFNLVNTPPKNEIYHTNLFNSLLPDALSQSIQSLLRIPSIKLLSWSKLKHKEGVWFYCS